MCLGAQTHGEHFPRYIISTLPLTEESVSHQANLVSEVDMFAPWHVLRENIFNLIISRNILKLYCPLLNPIYDEVVSNLYMLRPVMTYWILREFDTTLIIAVNDSQRQLLTK